MALNSDSMRSVPLTIEFPADGNGGTVTIKNAPSTGIWYSVNEGDKIFIEPTNGDIPVKAGDKISLYANGTGNGTGIHRAPYGSRPYLNIRCSSDCYLYGNVMGLISRDDFETLAKVPACAFYGLFSGNANIHNHSLKSIVLPATTLASSCYNRMFEGCSSLTEAPKLPAKATRMWCYEGMFKDCTSLVKAPALPVSRTMSKGCYKSRFEGCTSLTQVPELPATELAEYCYESMFQGCTSLKKAPALLPADALWPSCYQSMFKDCTSLVEAPQLPATYLDESCYKSMFQGCTSLTRVPKLTASTFNIRYHSTRKSAYNCYQDMFQDCINLSSITCYASKPSSYYSQGWLKGVSPSGTFTKKKGVEWSRGTDGIPGGWTVIEVD